MPQFSADVQASFCATVVDEWVRRGIAHVVVAPGSRSTPLAVAVAARSELSLHVVHDERSAAFVALGLGLDHVPALLVCTSGTAAANFLPAVVEAGLSDVPMIVLTADRPARLRNVGAAQTIDQVDLYGRAVRSFHDVGVPDDSGRAGWRTLAARAYRVAAQPHGAARPGPIHLNLQFDEPLLGDADVLPPDPPPGEVPRPGPDPQAPDGAHRPVIGDGIAELLRLQRGLILAGGRSGVTCDGIGALAAATGWPIVADPPSGCRVLDGAVTAADALARVPEFTARHRPDVVVRVGRPPASKALATWLRDVGAPLVQVGGPGVIDPDGTAIAQLPAAALADLVDLVGHARVALSDGPTGAVAWRTSWVDASDRAEVAIEAALSEAFTGAAPLNEPAVARLVVRHRPAGGEVVVASSMPVRDIEWYGGPTAVAHANRGANGIDGVLSTALGRALTGVPVIALVGDVAFAHDAGALTALRHRRTDGRPVDLRIVVADNDGGGIFSFLPQAAELGREQFEMLFGTPHGTDLVALARAHGLDADDAVDAGVLVHRLGTPGPSVTRVRTDRASNVAVHAMIHEFVASAVR
ncbi:2-succinyl-5-enolpyruvyl-6-hydroxy-3-cyclohexene-1-carboxylic-acid synthase [soil metagenome]